MKNKYLSASVYFLYGLLIVAGPQFLFRICTSEESLMKCYWTSRAEIGVGSLFLYLSVLTLFAKERRTLLWVNLFSLGAAVLALTFPLYWIGGCGNSRMPCQTTAFPIIYLLTGLLLLYLVINLVYLNKKLNVSGDE